MVSNRRRPVLASRGSPLWSGSGADVTGVTACMLMLAGWRTRIEVGRCAKGAVARRGGGGAGIQVVGHPSAYLPVVEVARRLDDTRARQSRGQSRGQSCGQSRGQSRGRSRGQSRGGLSRGGLTRGSNAIVLV